MATLQLGTPPPHEHEHITSPRHRVGFVVGPDAAEKDSAIRDPTWFSAPRSLLQAVLPAGILKKHSAASLTSSSATGVSSPPASPQTRSRPTNDNDADDSDDYFPPTAAAQQQPPPRRSLQIPVSMRASRSKHHDVRRLSMPRKSLSSAAPPPSPLPSLSPPPSPMSSRTGSSARESLSFDLRPSLDLTASALQPPGHRESMQRYRPSDLSALDMTRTLQARDSLAVDPAEQLASSSRVSVGHFGVRQSDDALSDFLRAARTGNLPALKAALEDPATDAAQRDPVHGQTALHIAVRFGQFAAVKLLCQTRPALLASRDNRQNSPLHLAAAKSRRVTKFLLEQGADVAGTNARGQTPLGVHVLTARRDEPLVTEMLLQHGADPNALLDASTLLHRAVERALYEIAFRLVRHGARLDVKDERERMVFDKVNRKVLRQLCSKIAFPPVWVPDAERAACMLCARAFSRFGLGVRRHHCRHCGRLCCGQCSHVSVESARFPKTFEASGVTSATPLSATRTTKATKKLERVCKTCSVVFKQREEAPTEPRTWSDNFVHKVVGCTWDEIEGQQPSASRRSSVA
ncbi:hypothetical protein PybrP1_002354 [[Pythium] brassicae (nom. inval.)]|nr:hypothetical protein PybrP1_002354 [[Pythium] brassicae (nom. inval.)]